MRADRLTVVVQRGLLRARRCFDRCEQPRCNQIYVRTFNFRSTGPVQRCLVLLLDVESDNNCRNLRPRSGEVQRLVPRYKRCQWTLTLSEPVR